MAEEGSRKRASALTALGNLQQIEEEDPYTAQRLPIYTITNKLRKELEEKGIKGFKRGGRVPRTGVYKLHRGELVVPKGKARLALDKVFP